MLNGLCVNEYCAITALSSASQLAISLKRSQSEKNILSNKVNFMKFRKVLVWVKHFFKLGNIVKF